MRRNRLIFAMLAVFLLPAAWAQSGYTLSTGGTLTATGGDGTSCTVAKIAGSTPALTVSCVTGGAAVSFGPGTLSVGAGKSGSSTFAVGDIACSIGLNATAAAVAMGSLGSVAVNEAALLCSVNIRTNGSVTSQQAVPLQTISWP